MNKKIDAVVILLGDFYGTNLPMKFSTNFDLSLWHGLSNIDLDDLSSSDNDFYWDTWQEVLDRAYFLDTHGNKFTLYQDGELFAICYELMTNEEKINFGFDIGEDETE